MGTEAETAPTLLQGLRWDADEKAELQDEINQQAQAQAHSHGQGDIALGIAHFPGEVHRRAETQQAEQHAAAADGIHQCVLLLWDRELQIAPVACHQHQAEGHQQGNHQLPEGEAVDPARQLADACKVDPGEQHQQGHRHQLAGTCEVLGAAHIAGEPGQQAREVLEQGQHFNRGQRHVGEPGAPAADESRQAPVAEQGQLGEGSGAVHQSAQLREHQRQEKGHHSADHPGQQACRAGDAGTEIRSE